MKKNQPKVSIIIPCYNVAPWVRQCLDSVMGQTLQEIEIICINDGSTDETGDILQAYAARDSRIVVFNQENAGVSAARNCGIDMAHAPYLMFVDPDDWIEPDCAELAWREITTKQVDMVIFDFQMSENGQIKPGWLTKQMRSEASLPVRPMTLSSGDLNWCSCCWGRLIRKGFLNHHHVRFPVGVKTAEDRVFCLLLAMNHPVFCLLDRVLYTYLAWNGITRGGVGCLASDFKALKWISAHPTFQEKSDQERARIIGKFIDGIRFYWNRYPENRDGYRQDIHTYYTFVTGASAPKIFKKSTSFRWLSQIERGINCQGTVRLLGFIPVARWLEKNGKTVITCLGLPVFGIRHRPNRRIYSVLGVPVLRLQW